MLSGLFRRTSRTSVPAPLLTACVSVVVPIYNHAPYVTQAVRSALDQGPSLREVVAVDDGSTDGSAEALRAAWSDDPRLVLWSQPNRGAHATIHAGLLRTTGDVLAILNSDDVYAPGRLDRLLGALQADPTADLAASGITFIDGAGAPVANDWYAAALDFLNQETDLALALINGNFLMSTSNLVFRRSLLQRIGLFAPLRYTHDLEFLLRALARGRRFALLLEEKLLCYRMHAGNTIKEEHGGVRMEWAAAAAGYLDALLHRAEPVTWDQLTTLERVLERHALARGVHLCLAWLRRDPSGLASGEMLRDPAFRRALQSAVTV
jgi:glycosyltransferase involved in cell wall biosynthesis